MIRSSSNLAKLTRPRIFGAIPRERLFALLDEARARPVTWISGPPGAGKTTLVAGYLDTRKVVGIWYQVDLGDGDPASFFYYLGQAAPGHRRKSLQSLPVLTPEYLPDLAGFARRYFRVLYARLPVGAAIVLDNYQEVPVESGFHQVVAVAVEELPENVGLIAISRGSPPQQFARPLAARQITMIEWDDLRLRLEETRTIASAEGAIQERTVRRLHDQCGGGGGGLRLILEEFRRIGVVSSVEHPQTLDGVFNYFADQVFEAAPPETQRFLLRSAVLPRMTPKVVQIVTDEPNTAKILEDLYRRHLFVDRRVGEELTYQYHALFRAFLLARAEEVLTKDEISRLQRRAAALLESLGLPDDAVSIYLSTQDWDAVALLIGMHAVRFLAQGRGQTLREWIAALPEVYTQRTPWLLYWHGTSLISVDQEHARTTLEQAYALFAAEGDTTSQLMTTSGIMEARFLQHTNHRLIDSWLPVHEKLLARVPADASAELRLRAYSAMLIALLYRQPGSPLLKVCVARVLELLDSEASADQRMIAATFVMWYCGYTGDFKLAALVAPIGEALAAKPEVTPLHRGTWWNWLGYCRGFQFDMEGERQALNRALHLGEANGLTQIVFFASYFAGLRELWYGRHDFVERCLKRVEELARPDSLIHTAIRHAFSGWAAVAQRQPVQALRSGKAAWEISQRLGSPSYLVHWGTPMIYGLVEGGRLDEARERLAEQRAALKDTDIRCHDPMFLSIEATIALREGDKPAAHVLVGPMFRLARENEHGGYLNLLHPWLPRLAAIALEDDVECDYVCELIRLARWDPPSQSMARWPWEWQIVTFGRFEVCREGSHIKYGRKAPKKPLALLRALIAAGDGGASESALADALWADEQGDSADRALAAAIHRLRILLGSAETVQVGSNQVKLNAKRVWVDAWAFDALTAEAEAAENEQRDAFLSKALALYHGAFLAEDSDSTWALSTRERLRAKFVRYAGQIASKLETSERHEQAAELYRRALEVDDLIESFYQGLLRCCAKLDRAAEGASVYQRLHRTLALALGKEPSRESERLYRGLLAGP